MTRRRRYFRSFGSSGEEISTLESSRPMRLSTAAWCKKRSSRPQLSLSLFHSTRSTIRESRISIVRKRSLNVLRMTRRVSNDVRRLYGYARHSSFTRRLIIEVVKLYDAKLHFCHYRLHKFECVLKRSLSLFHDARELCQRTVYLVCRFDYQDYEMELLQSKIVFLYDSPPSDFRASRQSQRLQQRWYIYITSPFVRNRVTDTTLKCVSRLGKSEP